VRTWKGERRERGRRDKGRGGEVCIIAVGDRRPWKNQITTTCCSSNYRPMLLCVSENKWRFLSIFFYPQYLFPLCMVLPFQFCTGVRAKIKLGDDGTTRCRKPHSTRNHFDIGQMDFNIGQMDRGTLTEIPHHYHASVPVLRHKGGDDGSNGRMRCDIKFPVKFCNTGLMSSMTFG